METKASKILFRLRSLDEAKKPSLKEMWDKLSNMNKTALLGYVRANEVGVDLLDAKQMDAPELLMEIMGSLFGEDVESELIKQRLI